MKSVGKLWWLSHYHTYYCWWSLNRCETGTSVHSSVFFSFVVLFFVSPCLVLSVASWGNVNLAVSSSSWEWRFLYSYERYLVHLWYWPAPIAGAFEVSWDVMVAGPYPTCCCQRSLNVLVIVAIIQLAPQFSSGSKGQSSCFPCSVIHYQIWSTTSLSGYSWIVFRLTYIVCLEKFSVLMNMYWCAYHL
jgi:hypothetical protein